MVERSDASGIFEHYQPLPVTVDECFDDQGAVRPEAARVIERFEGLGGREFRARQRFADFDLPKERHHVLRLFRRSRS